MLTPTLMAAIAERDQPPNDGAVYALDNHAYAAGLAVAPLLAGLIDDATGFRTAAITGAAVPGLAAALLLRPRPQSL